MHTGCARQTGQTCVLGGAPYSLGQLQKALVRVLSWMWHSIPITASYTTCQGVAAVLANEVLNLSALLHL